MASSIKKEASYKKKPGVLELSADRKTLAWTPAGSNSPTLTIPVSDITLLRQTPVTAPKAIIKFITPKDGADVEYPLQFTSSAARADLDTIRDALNELIAARQAAAMDALTKPSKSTAPVRQAPVASLDPTSDASLLANITLQMAILNEDPALMALWTKARNEVPADNHALQVAFNNNFWAARIGTLRASVIAKDQHQGETNVLSEIKFSVGNDGKTKLKMSKEQIQVIFAQHPMVLRVYNDLVPKEYTETQFWSNFWGSHLVKKLKGEKITDQDPEVPKIDKYALDYDGTNLRPEDLPKQFHVEHVPRFMDLEANNQNHSQQKGNAPDWTMRPNFHGKVQLLHVLNNMSERLMVQVAPSDGEAHGPIGMDEETFNELQLRDLERVADDNRIRLNVPSQTHIGAERTNGNGTSHKRDHTGALKALQADLRGQLELPTELADEDEAQAHRATKNILKTIKLRAASSSPNSKDEANLSGDLLASVKMTHSTTMEFLRYFWSVYLSGDDRKANELQQWVHAVTKSLERIEAVAAAAEEERSAHIAKQEAIIEAHKRQGSKRALTVDYKRVCGGRKAVVDMMIPTTRAVNYANGDYIRVHREQLAQQGPAA